METTNSKTVKVCHPNRVTHTYEQTIEGTVKEIFPLYCPIKELLWTENWNPKMVYSKSGGVEPDCIFTTDEEGQEATWYVTDYVTDNNQEKGRVEMIKIIPKNSCSKLVVNVKQINKNTTKAVITYSLTSLSSEANDTLKEFTKENYDISMRAWEKAMNYYLKTGKMLTGLPDF